MHGIGQPPYQNFAGCPIHDHNQIKEPVSNRDVGDVGAPDLLRTINGYTFQKIGINPVPWVRLDGSGPFVDGLKTHQAHRSPNTMTARNNPIPA